MKFETKSLSQCLSLVIDRRGVTPKKLGSDWADTGYRVLSANNVKSSGLQKTDEIRYVNKTTYQKWMHTEIQRDDILLTSEAPAGEVYVWDSDEKIVVGQRLYALRVKEDVNPWFLAFYLQSPKGKAEIKNKCSGSTVFGISAKTFDSIEIVLPDKTIQDHIADVLHNINSKIEINNALSSKLEDFTRMVYDYWFLQFEFPNEEGKPYKSSGGKMVWNEELKREIPEGWEVTSLRGKYNIERGISYTSKDIESGKGLPMLNLACIDTSRNYRDGELKYTTGCVTESEKLHGGELLIACTDLTRNADIVGCPILVPQDGKTYTYSMDLAKIYSTASSLTNMYLYQSLRTDFYHRYIKKWASGTNVLHLNLDGLNWYSMALPPVLLQKKYASLISTIEKKKSDILAENRQLTSLRDFLLPLLMNGQVTFKDEAASEEE